MDDRKRDGWMTSGAERVFRSLEVPVVWKGRGRFPLRRKPAAVRAATIRHGMVYPPKRGKCALKLRSGGNT